MATRNYNYLLTIFPADESLTFKEQEINEIISKININKIKYYIYQGELAPTTKRQHLQMYVQFNQKESISTIKKIFQNKSLHAKAQTYGDAEPCITYCTDRHRDEEGNPKEIFKPHTEYGTPKHQGKRNDLVSVIDKMKEGQSPMEQAKEDDKVAQLYLQYHNGLNEMFYSIQQENTYNEIKEELSNIKLREFQKEIIEIVKGQPDDRTIYWYYETTGNTGKSLLTKYLTANYNAIMINTGKQAEILHAYKYQPVIVFDLPRTLEQNESIYTTMEVLKNGHYFSSKYDSKSVMTKVPHIIVFANYLPDTSKLSKDRWNIKQIQPDYSTKQLHVRDILTRPSHYSTDL
ncbi:hypothetical protein [Rheinheimera sp.]|uniref:hypothetical protein n=1 Tax=Rheinheimera sp. TaxID=1869214 RepID=UPI0040474F21